MNAIEVNEIKSILGFNNQTVNEELDEIIQQCQFGDFLSRVFYIMTKYRGIQDQKKKEAQDKGLIDCEMYIQFTEDSNLSDLPKVELNVKSIKSNFLSSYNELKYENTSSCNTNVTFSSDYISMIKDKFKEQKDINGDIIVVNQQDQLGINNNKKGVDHEIEKIEPKAYHNEYNYQKRQFNKKNQNQKKGKNKQNQSQQYPLNQGGIEQEIGQSQIQSQSQSQIQNQSQIPSQNQSQIPSQSQYQQRKAKNNNQKNKGNNSNNNY